MHTQMHKQCIEEDVDNELPEVNRKSFYRPADLSWHNCNFFTEIKSLRKEGAERYIALQAPTDGLGNQFTQPYQVVLLACRTVLGFCSIVEIPVAAGPNAPVLES